MKDSHLSSPRPTMIALLTLALLACFCCGLPAPSLQAQGTQELRVQITYEDGRRQIGILQNSNEQGISFALQTGAVPTNIPYASLKAIEFPDATQFMQTARAAYVSGDWEMAEAGMAQVADAFPQASYTPNNFAAEARFYQMDSLRKLGRYSDIGRLFATPSGKAMEFALNDVFDQQIAMLRLWAYYGAGNIEALGTELEAYLKPQIGDAKMLPDAQFTDGTPEYDIAQLAFLRGKVHQAAKRTPQALEDYYRAFTLSQANQSVLAKDAMTAAMAIQAAEANESSKPSKLWAVQSLAYVFKNAFNGGEIDASLAEFAVKPDLPNALAPAPAKQEDDTAAPAATPPADADKAGEDAKEKAK